jgi:hypothetical protein
MSARVAHGGVGKKSRESRCSTLQAITDLAPVPTADAINEEELSVTYAPSPHRSRGWRRTLLR